jgi:hypothetical protein
MWLTASEREYLSALIRANTWWTNQQEVIGELTKSIGGLPMYKYKNEFAIRSEIGSNFHLTVFDNVWGGHLAISTSRNRRILDYASSTSGVSSLFVSADGSRVTVKTSGGGFGGPTEVVYTVNSCGTLKSLENTPTAVSNEVISALRDKSGE